MREKKLLLQYKSWKYLIVIERKNVTIQIKENNRLGNIKLWKYKSLKIQNDRNSKLRKY